MSRPAGMAQISPHVTRTGIVIAVSPTSDPTHQIQLERANGSSTGTFTQVAMLAGQVGPGQYPTYIDVLPNDGATRIYRAKAYKQGYTQSTSYTPLLKAKPAIIPEGVTVQTPITGHKIGSVLSFSTATRVQYGSAAVPSSYAKTVVINPALYQPETSTIAGYSVTQLALTQLSNTGSSLKGYYLTVPTPPGATITQFQTTYARSTAGVLILNVQGVLNGVASLLVQWTNPAAGVHALTSSSFGPLTSTGYDNLIVHAVLKSPAAGTKSAVGLCRFKYRTADLNKTY